MKVGTSVPVPECADRLVCVAENGFTRLGRLIRKLVRTLKLTCRRLHHFTKYSSRSPRCFCLSMSLLVSK